MNGSLSYLPDGTPVFLRPIRPDDKRRLSDGLRNLSPDTVHRRFLSPKTRFTSAELKYLTELDGVDHVALVVEDPATPVRSLIAVGRYVRLPEDPLSAEAAIVVCDDWQQRGVGSLIATELADLARTAGIVRFTATMASDNVPAHKLMRRLTDQLQLRREAAGVSAATLDLVA